MNLGESIPKINSIAVLLILAFILNMFGGYLLTPYLTMLFSPEEYGQYILGLNTASMIELVLSSILNIIVAIWTYREAKKQNERPLTWTVFSLFFGLIAVVLFYLFLLLKEMKKLNKST